MTSRVNPIAGHAKTREHRVVGGPDASKPMRSPVSTKTRKGRIGVSMFNIRRVVNVNSLAVKHTTKV